MRQPVQSPSIILREILTLPMVIVRLWFLIADPAHFLELEKFDWEKPIFARLERLEATHEPDFDEQ